MSLNKPSMTCGTRAETAKEWHLKKYNMIIDSLCGIKQEIYSRKTSFQLNRSSLLLPVSKQICFFSWRIYISKLPTFWKHTDTHYTWQQDSRCILQRRNWAIASSIRCFSNPGLRAGSCPREENILSILTSLHLFYKLMWRIETVIIRWQQNRSSALKYWYTKIPKYWLNISCNGLHFH